MDPSSSPSQGHGRGLIPLEQCEKPLELRKPHSDIPEENTSNSVEAGTSKLLGSIINTSSSQSDLPGTERKQPTGFQLSVYAQEFVPQTFAAVASYTEAYQNYEVNSNF